MAAEENESSESVEAWAERMDDIMQVAVEKAIDENRRLGLHPVGKTDAPDSARVAENDEET